MNPVECANCGRLIGRLETPRVFREQVVCVECWDRLTASAEDDPLASAVQKEAMGYESKFDTAARMRVARPTPVKSVGTSPILIVGRIIFGCLMLLGLAVAVRGKFGATENEREIYTGINIFWPSALIFFVTFVKRAL